MQPLLMTLKILLPYRIFSEQNAVTRIVAETRQGAFGILPQRLDCVAALEPGIFMYETHRNDEHYVALDEGVLVKNGREVLVSVRNAIAGTDLHQLREAVEHEFLTLDEQERSLRYVMTKLESSFVRRFADFRHD
ncbi:MAG: F0F1 ATP synthase subunit epsilon [Nitrospirales bacterium]|nr:MAG: F0F1 ATP synthase subunit epsilon [Nitrospirales bacterium]